MATSWRGQYYKYREFSLNLIAIYKQRSDVKAFLEIILSLTTLIIFIVFALKPTALTMVTLNKDIGEKQSTLDNLNKKISDLQAANNVFIQDQNVVPDIDAAIFSVPKPDTLSKQVLGLAAKENVSVLGMSVGQLTITGSDNTQPSATTDLKPLPPGAGAMNVSVNVKGTYPELLAFLKDLENSRIPIKFDVLTITSSQLQNDNSIVELITARVPYLVPNQ